MKVIDAFWEKRNLGVDTTEFIIEQDDDPESVERILAENERIYNVVKIPSSRTDLHFLMQEKGYVYIETAFHLVHDLKTNNLTPISKRMTDCVSYELMQKDDLDQLYSEISKGMFTTDRIALHPKFGIEIANQRYINWIDDEISKGTQVYKLIYKDSNIGFFTFKEIDDGVFYPFIAGMYEKYRTSGLGLNMVIKPVEEAIKRKGKYNSTFVVVNNLNSLTVNIGMGYKITDFNTVFHKYKGKGE